MKKASKILFRVGGIISIVLFALFLTMAIIFIVSGSPAMTEAIKKGIEEGTIQTTFVGSIEDQAKVVQAALMSSGIVFMIFAIFNIPNAILSFMTLRMPSTIMYIFNIVFGAISGCEVNLVGAIFGLIADRHQSQPAEPAEPAE